MTNLGKHTLPFVLVVHVHAGEVDTVPVPSIGVNPAEEDKVLLLVNLCNVFKAIHSATVRLTHLSWDHEVGHTKLVVTKLTTEGSQSLDIPVTVNLGNFEELGVGDDVIRHSNSPKINNLPLSPSLSLEPGSS